MKRKLVLVLVLIALLLAPAPTMAWNETGHKVVARIAWEHMQPQTREKFMAMMLLAPEDSGIGLLFGNDSRPMAYRQRDYFAMLSTWPDIIKDRNAPIRGAKYGHGTWHYTNYFWKQVNGVAVNVPELQPAPENIVERLFFMQKALKDPATPAADKAVYLSWVLHLVGDIQQPMHCSARVTDTEPQGDQGGNLFLLSPADAPREQRKTLHAYWDDILNLSHQRTDPECDPAFVTWLTRRITKAHPLKKFAGRIKAGEYDVWAQEGLAHAKQYVYPPTLLRNQIPSKKYREQVYRVSEESIALGGYRLAQMLDAVFAGQ